MLGMAFFYYWRRRATAVAFDNLIRPHLDTHMAPPVSIRMPVRPCGSSKDGVQGKEPAQRNRSSLHRIAAAGRSAAAGGSARSGSGFSTADHCRSRPQGRDLPLREMSLLLGGCLPGRRRERRRELQPPVSEGQPSHATLTQSGGQRRSQNQRKHLRDRVSPLGPTPGTQSSHRSHCPSTVSPDLADPTSGSPLRRAGPSGHQTIEAKAHGEDNPATSKPGLSDRTARSSTEPGTSTVIFEPD